MRSIEDCLQYRKHEELLLQMDRLIPLSARWVKRSNGGERADKLIDTIIQWPIVDQLNSSLKVGPN